MAKDAFGKRKGKRVCVVTGKVIYNKNLAKAKAAGASERTGEDIRPYSCKHCGGNHIGHHKVEFKPLKRLLEAVYNVGNRDSCV